MTFCEVRLLDVIIFIVQRPRRLRIILMRSDDDDDEMLTRRIDRKIEEVLGSWHKKHYQQFQYSVLFRYTRVDGIWHLKSK